VLKSSPGICEVEDDATVLKSALGMMPVKRSPPKSLAVPSGWVPNGLLPSLADMGSAYGMGDAANDMGDATEYGLDRYLDGDGEWRA
jgi:hypothetical protein